MIGDPWVAYCVWGLAGALLGRVRKSVLRPHPRAGRSVSVSDDVPVSRRGGDRARCLALVLRARAARECARRRCRSRAHAGRAEPRRDAGDDRRRRSACSGWTRTVRPPTEYTNALKLRQMRAYGETGPPSAYQEDHLISPRARRPPDRPAQPLAGAVPAGGAGRPDRERAERAGLRRLADARAGAGAGVGAQAHAR